MSRINFKCPKCGLKRIDHVEDVTRVKRNLWWLEPWVSSGKATFILRRENNERLDGANFVGFFCRKCEWRIPVESFEELWVWIACHKMLKYFLYNEEKALPARIEELARTSRLSKKFLKDLDYEFNTQYSAHLPPKSA